MADKVACEYYNGTIFFNEQFFETLFLVIIIIWLLKWLFGFNGYFGCGY